MLPIERQKKFLDLLSKKDMITIPTFAEKFNISIETVRRDLSILEKQNKIEKVYGGAKLKKTSFNEPAMKNRMNSNIEQKNAIGKTCSQFIKDGECIFIDSGSTTYHIASYLSDKKNLTIITNSIPIATKLLNSDFEIILIGGRVRHSEHSIVSYDYLFNFSQLNISKSFICAGGITCKNGVTDFNMQEAVTRKTIIERSKEIFVAADSSKFGKDVMVNITPISKIDYIVTDSLLNKKIASELKKTNTNLMITKI